MVASNITIGGRTSKSMNDFEPSAFLAPYSKIVTVTKNDDDPLPDGACRALWVGTAGTANIVTQNGDELTNFPLAQGENKVAVLQVKLGGDADDIWACY